MRGLLARKKGRRHKGWRRARVLPRSAGFCPQAYSGRHVVHRDVPGRCMLCTGAVTVA